ncbi:MAG: hypothetical protein NTX45_21690 [Proteobacteria bacterium]|nr:hypothetical protein [Pseudomonadota bacterium]
MLINQKTACALFILSFILVGTSKAEAKTVPFPSAGIETVYSLGTFQINNVDPSFFGVASLLTSYGFQWDESTSTLNSPILFDNDTQISHGTPYASTVGGPLDRVDTQIKAFDMSAGSIHLLAGEKAAPPTPASMGVVESLKQSSGGFEAKSSFAVYVNATVSELGGAYFYNRDGSPLLISNPLIGSFPPTVVYMHDASASVPIYLHNAAFDPNNDHLFGYLSLAGHGVASAPDNPEKRSQSLAEYESENEGEKKNFDDTVASFTPAPLPHDLSPRVVSSVPEPEEWAMMLVGAVMVSFQVKRKNAK